MGADFIQRLLILCVLGLLVGAVYTLGRDIGQIKHELRNYGCTASDVADAARAEAELRKLGDKNPVVRCAP